MKAESAIRWKKGVLDDGRTNVLTEIHVEFIYVVCCILYVYTKQAHRQI
jgi:hypothetical protein